MELIELAYSDVFLRLIIATLLGMTLGLERAVAGKTAGMRTYGLASLGAALFVIVGIIGAEYYAEGYSLDPLRVASQIVVGIGFIGAGLIIFRDAKVRNLTTAAGLWVAAGIGIASGYGLYYIAAAAAVITLIVFTVVWYIERFAQKHADMFYEDKEEQL